MSYSRVILLGKLGQDPELRYTKSNLAMCKASLAVNERVKSGDEWKEITTWTGVLIFGKRAEAFEKHLRQGSEVLVEGKLRTDEWNDKITGAKRVKHYVLVDDWQFVGSREKRAEPAAEKEKGTAQESFPEADDTPF